MSEAEEGPVSLPVESEVASGTAIGGIPLARPIHLPPTDPSGGAHDDLLLLCETRASAWADIGALLVILAAFELYATFAVATIVGINDLPIELSDTEKSRLILVPALAVRVAGVLAIVALILRHRRQSIHSIGLGRRGVGLNCLLGIATVGVAYGLIIVALSSLAVAWPGLTEQMQRNAERIMGYVPQLNPSGFVLFSFVVGLYEELLFRGFLMTRFRRATGSWTIAVLLSTCVFVALHVPFQEWIAMVPITILSLVFSLATIQRRSILPAIVGHWLFDLSQFLGMYYASGGSWA